VRTLQPETRKLAKERLHAIIRGTAAAAGCDADIKWEEGYPVTFNDAAATERFFRIAREGLGPARVLAVEHPTMGGEDFAFYGQRIPACFFILGVRPPDRPDYPNLHQPTYDFNDDALATGIETMCRLVLEE
jgi:metal-dependent amidase/aminoacylase/carboxypeptidase family protein